MSWLKWLRLMSIGREYEQGVKKCMAMSIQCLCNACLFVKMQTRVGALKSDWQPTRAKSPPGFVLLLENYVETRILEQVVLFWGKELRREIEGKTEE